MCNSAYSDVLHGMDLPAHFTSQRIRPQGRNPDCTREFLYKEIDPLHPREVVNSGEPAKPPIRTHGESKVCPYCGVQSQYRRADLKFDPECPR